MATHLTEEEQIEAIKRWWRDNGKFTVGVIVVALAGYLGWNVWQDRQLEMSQAASARYSELLAAVEVAPGESLTDEQRSTARHIADDLIKSSADSLYANLAALMMAKLAVEDDDPAQARSLLQNVLDNPANSTMESLARLRLARTATAAGDYEEALTLLATNGANTFEALFSEARGDVFVARDQLDKAHSAYQQALAQLSPEQNSLRSLLQIKADSTRVASSDDEAPDAVPQETGAEDDVEGDA